MIHPLADVEKGARVGRGTSIWRWAHVRKGARIGDDCSIGQGCYIAATARIGDRVRIQNGVNVWDGVRIGDDAFIGPGVCFTNVRLPKVRVKQKTQPTWVYPRTMIGANATIRCGVSIGEGAVVGAGAVVLHNIGDGETWVGNPARRTR